MMWACCLCLSLALVMSAMDLLDKIFGSFLIFLDSYTYLNEYIVWLIY